MDFTFTFLIFSIGLCGGTYFIYWHIDSVITERCDSLVRDIESLVSIMGEWRLLLLKDVDSIKKSIEKVNDSIATLKELTEDIKKEEPKQSTPIRKAKKNLSIEE